MQVDDAIKVIRSALAGGMSWSELKQLVKDEKAKRNPVALAIEQLKLETSRITLSLRSGRPARPCPRSLVRPAHTPPFFFVWHQRAAGARLR